VPKGHKPAPQPTRTASPQPAECRDALQWFVDSVGLYQTSARGLIATDFMDEHESLLDAAIINLKSRGINPVVITGDALFRQGEFLWEQAVQHTRFGRPLASQFELEMTGADVLILRNVEAPETAHHLWYLYHQVFYPRALAGKPLLMTSALSLEELHKYGEACDDFEFAGRKLTWQKLAWLMEATCVDLAIYRTLKDEALPPMLKAEHVLLNALKERGLAAQPQHVLGDYMLDIAMLDRDRKLDIECDVLTSLDSTGANAWQAKKNLLLLSDGWKVLKFTAAEIISNTPACVDVVEEVWTQGRKRSSVGRLLSGQAAASVPELPVDDDVQRLVITHGAGPCAVEGGAGTGKSSCVVHRVAYLLAQGINPDRILVISHSQDTVKSLKTAVEAIADRQAAQRVSFHSWHDLGLKILKENLSAVKRKPPLKVESNPQKVIQRLLTKHKKDLDPVTLELSEELDEFTIASLISLYKANLITPKHLKERSKSDVDELVSKVFQGYEDQLQKINRIDRDDMVSLAAHALVDQSDLRTKYQNQYDYVLVDEYQDATAAGDLLARILAAPQDNLYLTGDEDEAIYESKGGLPRLMADVSIRMPNARCYILEKNWRCHPAIVDHTRQLITNLTRRRIQKDMVSGWGAAPTTAIIGPQFSESEQAEAEWVADEISILIDSGRNPKDIAVLYRYHRYGIIIEEALSRRNIRCVTSHPEAGLIPDEVGDVMAFLKLVMDPDGPKARESFERVCQLRVKEVDPKLSSTIASFAEANNLSYLKAVEIYSEAVAEQSCLDLSQLVKIIRTMHQDNHSPAEVISLLKRTQRLGDYYRAVKVPPGVNYEPLRKLTALEEDARNYKTVAEFVKAQTATPGRGSSSTGSYPYIA
jgi:superfamily I DNA/RNA helicase/very-short-patch-repair endonuclease